MPSGSSSSSRPITVHGGCGGAGIGTGEGTGNVSKGGVDYIWLENIKKLHAEGGNNSAGAGIGGKVPFRAVSPRQDDVVRYGDVFDLYLEDGESSGVPAYADTYRVKAKVAETGAFDTASAVMTFTISPAATKLDAFLTGSDTSVSATAVVSGLYEVNGNVKFTVTRTQEGHPTEIIEATEPVAYDETERIYSATLSRQVAPSGEYTVDATFVPRGSNYLTSSVSDIRGTVDKQPRTITGERRYGLVYGDDDVDLKQSLRAEEGKALDTDIWTFEPVYDVYKDNLCGSRSFYR